MYGVINREIAEELSFFRDLCMLNVQPLMAEVSMKDFPFLHH